MNRQIQVAPSILSADFTNLGNDIRMINQSGADYIHFDVMDGVFVPNISFGLPVIKQVAQIATKPLDVHLMIVSPDHLIVPFRQAGADIITVHYEACTHLHRTLSAIRETGARAGVSLNPHTPVGLLEDVLPYMDLALIMSVNPGFGGQSFIGQSYKKIEKLRKMVDQVNPKCLIEVDGGVSHSNARQLFDAGADILVSGSFIFDSENPLETIRIFKES